MMAKTDKKGFFYGYVIVIACFFMMVVWWGSFHSFSVFFDSLLNEFNWGRGITAGAFSLMSFLLGLYSIPIARLCNKFAPRIVIAFCGFLCGLGYVLMSQITTVWQIYILYAILIAIGMGAYISILPIVARWFVKRRGLMTGIVFSGMGIGMIVVSPLISRLISFYDWRITYIIMGIITMAVLTIGAQFLRRDPYQSGKVPYGTDSTDIAVENARTTGISYKKALQSGQFWQLGSLYFIYLVGHNAATVHIVVYAIGLGMTPLQAASLLSIFGVFLIAGFTMIGMTADKIGNRNGFIISFILMTVAFIAVLSIADAWMLYLFVAILGFACGGMQVLFSPIVAELFGLRSHGEILASTGFIGGMGSALGAAMAGYIFDVTGSYSLAFTICVVLSAMAIVSAWLLRPLFRSK